MSFHQVVWDSVVEVWERAQFGSLSAQGHCQVCAEGRPANSNFDINSQPLVNSRKSQFKIQPRLS